LRFSGPLVGIVGASPHQFFQFQENSQKTREPFSP